MQSGSEQSFGTGPCVGAAGGRWRGSVDQLDREQVWTRRTDGVGAQEASRTAGGGLRARRPLWFRARQERNRAPIARMLTDSDMLTDVVNKF